MKRVFVSFHRSKTPCPIFDNKPCPLRMSLQIGLLQSINFHDRGLHYLNNSALRHVVGTIIVLPTKEQASGIKSFTWDGH